MWNVTVHKIILAMWRVTLNFAISHYFKQRYKWQLLSWRIITRIEFYIGFMHLIFIEMRVVIGPTVVRVLVAQLSL